VVRVLLVKKKTKKKIVFRREMQRHEKGPQRMKTGLGVPDLVGENAERAPHGIKVENAEEKREWKAIEGEVVNEKERNRDSRLRRSTATERGKRTVRKTKQRRVTRQKS